jgi:hypothetical protein
MVKSERDQRNMINIQHRRTKTRRRDNSDGEAKE